MVPMNALFPSSRLLLFVKYGVVNPSEELAIKLFLKGELPPRAKTLTSAEARASHEEETKEQLRGGIHNPTNSQEGTQTNIDTALPYFS